MNLAETHWELAYLGLTDGSVRTHALETARTHAENAARLAPEAAPIRFMLGRIQLTLGDVVPASASFTRAINLGYPRRRVLPYLAECAYRRKELDVVPDLMREVAASPQDNAYLAHVTEMWAS
jgi:cytochrome c-type biogenesis protein CcmH/NrfG